MPFTPDEQIRITKVIEGMRDPTKAIGDAFDLASMVQLFTRIVTLRDFAAQQIALNQDLLARITQLELRAAYASTDIAQAYLQLIPGDSGEL